MALYFSQFRWGLFSEAPPGDADFKVSDPRHRHNKDADNLLNMNCNQRSAAEVIRDHEDFLRPINSATKMNSNFNVRLVVEPERRRVVIVMDISGSMGSDNRLKSLIGAVNHYIAFTLETGSECALISFTGNPTVLQNFILVDSPAVRRQLMQSVSNLTAGGGTCIGGAVQEAMKLLGEDPTSPTHRSSGQILLVTEGEENEDCSISLDSTIDAISKTSLRVNTIRFGESADMRMSLLASVTNGSAQFIPVDSNLAASKLLLQLTSLQSDLAGVNRTVVLDSRQVPSDLRYPVEFDVSARSNLVFSLFLPSDPAKVGSLRLVLRSPSGRTFDCSGGSSAVCTVDAAVGSVTVQIPDAEVESGKWTLANLAVGLARRIRRQAASQAQIVVTGDPFGIFLTDTIVKVSPNNLRMVKYDTSINVYVNLLPKSQVLNAYQMYARVTLGGHTEVARFCLLKLKHEKGHYIARVPLYAVQKAGLYLVDVHLTYPSSMVVSAGSLTVQEEDPNFDRRRIMPEQIVEVYTKEFIRSSKILEILWYPVEDPSGLLPPKAEVPVYSIRYREYGGNCSTANGYDYSFCPELAVTNQSSVNIYNQYMALNEPLMWISVIAISAANVSSLPSYRFSIPPTSYNDYFAEDKKLWCELPKSKTPNNSLDPTVANDPNKAKSTVDSMTKSSPRNSTQAKSSAQLNVDLAWLSAGTVCCLAVLTVSAQQWLIQ